MFHILKLLKRKKLLDVLFSAALLAVTAGLIALPDRAVEGGREGLTLCFNVIIPSLFPFFVLSSLVVDLGLAAWLGRMLEGLMRPLFRVSGSCAAALAMGFIGGYPVGARTALQLYRQGMCSKGEAERLLAFCNNSGPAFILGVVGAGVFGSGKVGLLLYLTHTAASLLVGLLFRFHGPPPSEDRPVPPPIRTVRASKSFTDAVTGAFRSTLNICAFVVFFAVLLRLLSSCGLIAGLARLLSPLGIDERWTYRLAAGLLELSSGVSSLSGAGDGSISAAAFMLGWAGLSVHCQVLSFLGDSGLSARTYIAGKLCHGAIAALLTWGVTRLFPLTEPVSAYLAEQADSIAGLDFSTSLTVSLATVFLVWLLWAVLSGAPVKKSCGKTGRHHI